MDMIVDYMVTVVMYIMVEGKMVMYVSVQVKIEATRFAKKNNFATLQKVRSGLAGVLPRPKERVPLHSKGLYTGVSEHPHTANYTVRYNMLKVYTQLHLVIIYQRSVYRGTSAS